MEGANHAAVLTIIIQEIMAKYNHHLSDLDAIAISAGPGSYTGLRIGAAVAKGLCYSLSKPLLAVDSLQALAFGMFCSVDNSNVQLFCPTVDARRGEIYYGIFGKAAEMIRPSTHVVVDDRFLEEFGDKDAIIIGGSGRDTCRKVLSNRMIHYDDSTHFSAAWMVKFAEDKWRVQDLIDAVLFEPHYIKPAFISTRKKNS
jgi:tRNA threonylcarbamoyladenosine biosynthesis protein TsaB